MDVQGPLLISLAINAFGCWNFYGKGKVKNRSMILYQCANNNMNIISNNNWRYLACNLLELASSPTFSSKMFTGTTRVIYIANTLFRDCKKVDLS